MIACRFEERREVFFSLLNYTPEITVHPVISSKKRGFKKNKDDEHTMPRCWKQWRKRQWR